MGFIRWLFGLIELVLVLGLLSAAGVAAVGVYYFLPGQLAEPKTIVIERGSGMRGIAETLQYEGVFNVAQGYVFQLGAFVSGQRGELKAGEYEFPANISPAGVTALLASGNVVIHKVTVVDGMTVREVADILKAEPTLTGEVGTLPPEGLMLPETYFFNRGDTRAELVARMRKSAEEALAQAWANRAANLPYRNMQEALTMASIVEKETGVAAERPRVAGVFVNRLRKGMRLQSDPTAIYPLSNFTGNLGRELTRRDLESTSPYNTYTADGLPPGPIANPGLASIKAALNPEEHDYFYFVADGTGGHAFARTLDEHNRNVANWRRLQGR